MSSTSPAVRLLEPSEREAVRRLHEACFDDALAFDDVVLDRVFRHTNTINLVAEHPQAPEEGLGGFAAGLHGARPKARLLTLQTHPAARGRGVASALLDELTERLEARRARVLELEVHVDNEAAIALYEKNGFHVEREDPTAYPSLDPPDGYVMHKALDP